MSQSQEKIDTCDISSTELLVAKDVIVSFNSAYKYYSLYPEGHSYSQNYLAKLKKELDNFLHEYKKLRIDVQKNDFFYKGESIFAGHADEHSAAYLLTRDRILFIEFTEHVELIEITTLFDIFNAHRNPLEETDGDIATTLWHFKFKHIHYEAADIFAMEAIDFELSMFKAAPGAGEEGSEGDGSNASAGYGHGHDPVGSHDTVHQQTTPSPHHGAGTSSGSENAYDQPLKNLLMLAKESDLSVLNPEEQHILQSYIDEEEVKNNAHDVIDILLIVLSIESNEIDFATILEFLEFEFFDAMMREDYFLAYKICKNVNNICQAVRAKKAWTVPLVNLFFTAISKEERFHELPFITHYNDHLSDPEILKYIWPILELLSAEIMFTLATLTALTPIENLHLRNKIIEIIGNKARQDPVSFANLLEQSGEETNVLLFPVINKLADKDANRVYLKMTLHPSPEVRRIGIDGFFQTPRSAKTNELHHLLRDNNRQLRERVLTYLAQTEISFREELLIAYLGADGRTTDDEDYVMHCYKLLSRSPSPESIDFLREVLLESKLTSIISSIDHIHKTCAACALKSFGTKEGKEILCKGAESMRPDVRNACRKVLEL